MINRSLLLNHQTSMQHNQPLSQNQMLMTDNHVNNLSRQINQANQMQVSNQYHQQSYQFQSSPQEQSTQSQAQTPQIAIINMNQNQITYRKSLLVALSPGRVTPNKVGSPVHSPVVIRTLNTPTNSPQSRGSSPLQSRGKVSTHSIVKAIGNVNSLLTTKKPVQIQTVTNSQQKVIIIKQSNNSSNLDDQNERSPRTFSSDGNSFNSPANESQLAGERQLYNMDQGSVVSETRLCRVETNQSSLPANVDRHESQFEDQYQCQRPAKLDNYQSARSDASFDSMNNSYNSVQSSPSCEYFCSNKNTL